MSATSRPAAAVGRPAEPRPLLALRARQPAVVLVAACGAVVALLGVWFHGQSRPGSLDHAIDGQLQASLGPHQAVLSFFAQLGQPGPVTAMTAALVIACLATRRWRGAILVAVAVPAAGAITELLLKPLVGRTLDGAFSLPSGRATGAFTVAASCAVLLLGSTRPRLSAGARLALSVAAVAAACAVAVAAVALRYHYFTDTVAGAAVGIGTVLAAALVIDLLGALRNARRPPAPTLGAASGWR